MRIIGICCTVLSLRRCDRILIAVIALTLTVSAIGAGSARAKSASTNPDCAYSGVTDSINKVIWIFEENHSYSQIINNGVTSGRNYDPNIQQYANNCYSAGEMHNEFHPSQPNYMAATSGTVAEQFNDCGGNSAPCQRNIDNIFSQIDHHDAGLTWKSYEEDMTSYCQDTNGGPPGFTNYVMKHNPAEHYAGNTNPATDVGGGVASQYSLRADGSGTCVKNDIPMDSQTNSMDFYDSTGNQTNGAGNFLNDLGEGGGCLSNCADSLPNFSFIAPNLVDDMHGGSISAADKWLKFWIPKIEATQSYQQGHVAIFITWDEGSDPQDYPAGCVYPGAGTPSCREIGQTGIGPFDCTQGTEATNPVITSSQPASGGDLNISTGVESPQCHIPTIIMSAGTPAGQTDTVFHNHYGMLKTTEELLGLPLIQNNGNVGATNCSYTVSNYDYPQSSSNRTTCDQWHAGDNLSAANDFCSTATGLNCGGSDTSTPTVPSGVAATAASSTEVDLSWNASTDSNDPSSTLHYVVEQSNDGSTYTVINNNVVGTAYAVTSGLSPATTYYFKVAAVDPAGNESVFSTAASATTQSAPDTTPPTVPAGLATSVVSANEIDLSWSQSTDPDNAQSSLHYLIEQSTDGTSYSVLNNNVTSANCTPTCAYKVTGLSASTLYYFKVAAADPAANQSAYSSAASATTQSGGTPPPVPTGLTAIGVSGDDVHLSWNTSTGAAGYDIYRNGVFRTSVTTTSFEDSGLPFNSTNTYQVDAHDGSTPPATSALSSAVSATTLSSNCSTQTGAPSDPNPPSNGSLLPTASSSNLHLNGLVTGTNGSWCGEQDATGSHVMTFTYQWQKSSDGSTNWTNITNMGRGINYTIMSGAIPYYLRLQVTANNGISPSAQQYSNVVGPTS